MRENDMEKGEKNKTAFEVRLKGIRLAVWQNESETDGRHWFTATPSRRYVDSATNEAKYSTSFSAGDLVLLQEAIRRTLDWMSSQSEPDGEE
jgi:hypothetical protein